MQYFDLHCDTLYRAVTENGSLIENDFHISLNQKTSFEKWTQCFAIWIPDDISVSEAVTLFEDAVIKLRAGVKASDFTLYTGKSMTEKYNAIFTVEGGRIIGSDLQNIKMLADCNVKILTLTWNGDNQIACGAQTKKDLGLSAFGEKAVKELENNRIIVDVSHLSDKSFYDVAAIATQPFIASHSNSRAVCNNKRNLTDEQFKIIKEKGGLVGLNFYRDFLNDNGNASMYDILKHCEHFLSLGGEDVVAIGSDFDGADMPADINGVVTIPEIKECFLRHNYNETLINKLFWANASNFLETFDNRDILL